MDTHQTAPSAQERMSPADAVVAFVTDGHRNRQRCPWHYKLWSCSTSRKSLATDAISWLPCVTTTPGAQRGHRADERRSSRSG